MTASPNPLLLVGSIPLDSMAAVLNAVPETISDQLTSVTDGETGMGSNWIGGQYALLAEQDPMERRAEL